MRFLLVCIMLILSVSCASTKPAVEYKSVYASDMTEKNIMTKNFDSKSIKYWIIEHKGYNDKGERQTLYEIEYEVPVKK